MTDKPRKPRTDSIGNLHRILAAANIEIVPPAHIKLDDIDLPYWHSLVDEFARADLSEHQLDMLAFLARLMADLEREQRALFKGRC